MRKIKVTCFRYKRHNDIYVSNVSFSTNALLSMLDVFSEQKIMILIESDENNIRTVSSIGKSIGITEVVSNSPVPNFLAVCNKTELHCLLNRVNVNDFDGMFIANTINSDIPNELISALVDSANSVVKDRISDMSISINIPENQMVITFTKEKYELMAIKDKIRCAFGR